MEEAPNLRARDKNTSGNNGTIFVVANEPTTLQHVLNKYNYVTIIHSLSEKDHTQYKESMMTINKTRKN